MILIDESHVTIPQLRAMYNGDRARKENLIEYGFRLPSALDNRPLKFEEFQERINQIVYVSATPARMKWKCRPILRSRLFVLPVYWIRLLKCVPLKANG